MSHTILITGASTGIGKATALYFGQQGWNVVATMRTPDKADVELKNNTHITILPLDVTDQASIQAAVEQTIQQFGQIDVVLNNAGYGAIGIFEKATAEQIQKQFDVNVFGVMNVTRAVLPQLRQQRSGTIITITSMGGLLTFPLYSVYHGTKWALEGFLESLSFELRPFNINIKLIEPGAIATDFYTRSQDLFANDQLTAYDTYQQTALANTQNAGAGGATPETVAKVIYRAATDSSKRLRYPGSLQAAALLTLRRLLPTRWFMWLVRQSVER